MLTEECKKNGSAKPPKMPSVPAQSRTPAVEGSDRHQMLREKLHAKIAAMREQRRLDQQAKDKAFAQEKRAERIAADPDFVPRDRKRKAATVDAPREEEEEEIAEQGLEFSNMEFKQKKSAVPFDTWVNKAGTKDKRLKRQMAMAEEAQAKVEQADNPEAVAKKLAMDRALKKAQGIKVKDDLKKLKQTQDTIRDMKMQSSAKWAERKTNLKDSMADKQKKRKENIQKKVERKKGKNRPGFEGKQDEFLNEKREGVKTTRKERKGKGGKGGGKGGKGKGKGGKP